MAVKTFNIKVNGLESVLKNMEKYDKRVADDVDHELDVAAETVAAQARARAPKGKQNRLAPSIQANTGQKFRKSVTVGANFGAFVEFGTGSHVFKGPYAFTSEEKAFARQFYVSGKGRMRSRAFLFPAFDDEKPKLLERIKKVLFD